MTEHKFPRSNKVDICLAFVEKAKKSRSYKNLKVKFLQDLQFAYDTFAYDTMTLLFPTSEVGSPNPVPYVGKLLFSCHWSAVYSTEP